MLSPDRHWLAVFDDEKVAVLRMYGKNVQVFNCFSIHRDSAGRTFAAVKDALFSGDGKWLALTVKKIIYDSVKNRAGPFETLLINLSGSNPLVRYLKNENMSSGDICRFSPDNKWMATGGMIRTRIFSENTTVRLWPLTNPSRNWGMESFFLNGQDNAVLDFAFSKDSKYIFSASMDRSIIKWDIATKQAVFIQDAENALLLQSTFIFPFSNSNTLLTVNGYHLTDLSDFQKTLINYLDFDVTNMNRLARRVIARNLTPQEWEKYFPYEPYHKAFSDLK
jgi:WD40 repeat protein